MAQSAKGKGMSKQIEQGRRAYETGRGWRGVLTGLAMLTLMTGCANTGGSETEAAICDELRASLPTWSRRDTEQSKAEGAAFLDVFNAVCHS
jgi:hypothetical protein